MKRARIIPLLLFAGLMAVAALLRFPGETGFANYFEPELHRELADIRGIAEGRHMLIGPPQFLDARFHFGPASDYLMLPLAWATGFQQWSLALTSLVLSLATIAVGAHACQRWFEDRTVTAAFVLIATFSCLDVQFAKYGSSPNFVPLFVLIFFLCFERLARGGARWYHAGGAGLALAVSAQLHPVAGIGLALVMAAAALTGKVRLTGRQWSLFALGTLAPYAGYLYYEFTHGFENARGLFAIASGQRSFGGWAARFAETAAFWVSLWFNVHHMFGLPNLLGLWSISLMYGAVAVIGAAAFFEGRRRGVSAAPRGMEPHLRQMLTLWFCLPTALLLVPFGRINQLPIYYFLTFLPLGHLLMALGYKKMKDLRLPRTADVALATYLVLQLGQIALYHAHYPSLLTATFQ